MTKRTKVELVRVQQSDILTGSRQRPGGVTCKGPKWWLCSSLQYDGHPEKMPMDGHGVLGLCAPRACAIATAHADNCDYTFANEMNIKEASVSSQHTFAFAFAFALPLAFAFAFAVVRGVFAVLCVVCLCCQSRLHLHDGPDPTLSEPFRLVRRKSTGCLTPRTTSGSSTATDR